MFVCGLFVGSTARRWFRQSGFLLATAVVVAGLSACPETTSTGPAAGECVDADGNAMEEGDQTLADDGCNVCTCRNGELRCTRTACEPPPTSDGGSNEPDADGDAGVDAGVDAEPVEDRPDNCIDEDEDGYYRCIDEEDPELCDCTDANNPANKPEIDCDDTRWFVQPGGYEYPDNEIDDNCNELVDAQESPPCACALDGATVPDFASAMDLCDDTLASAAFSGDLAQVGVFADYFGDITPQQGGCYTVLSTGTAGSTTINSDGTSFCDCGFGSGCVDDPDPVDPDIEGVCDLGEIRLTLTPPKNARGFEFDFMFLSAEWPEFLCQDFNDTFYTVVETAAVGGGERTNISFDPEQRSITVNVGFFEAPRQWSTPLGQTPFGAVETVASCGSSLDPMCTLPGYCPNNSFCESPCDAGQSCVDLEDSGNYACIEDEAVDLGHAGSGSGWLVTRAPISEDDETITLTFSVHDEGDGIYDSLVILDSFRWVPYSPPVGTLPKD